MFHYYGWFSGNLNFRMVLVIRIYLAGREDEEDKPIDQRIGISLSVVCSNVVMFIRDVVYVGSLFVVMKVV